NFTERKTQIHIKRAHQVEHKIGQPVQTDQCQNQPAQPATKAAEKITQRRPVSTTQMGTWPCYHTRQGQTGQSHYTQASDYRSYLNVDSGRRTAPDAYQRFAAFCA